MLGPLRKRSLGPFNLVSPSRDADPVIPFPRPRIHPASHCRRSPEQGRPSVMTARRCAALLFALIFVAIANRAHAASTLEREIQFPPDRLTLTPRTTFTEVTLPG